VERGWLVPRHPSQLYQAACEGFLLFGVLLFLRFRPWSRAQNGRLSAVFLLGYALARFVVEFWREPDAGTSLYFGWMSRGQLLTLLLFAGGFTLLGFLKKQKFTQM
jgi:phosphatidylglycerol:prolipoprotein diacylglycerol transferase